MSDPILLIGSEGNMGQRYQAIMKYLDIPYVCSDINILTDWNRDYHSYLICTPTNDHYEQIKQCSKFGKPILCEKAITKDPSRLIELIDTCDFAMVNQYKYLVDPTAKGDTYYNYFRTGKDGLNWDCINIIGLSKTPAKIMNKSPIWSCMINGQELSIKDMDLAYCKMIDRWYKKPYTNKDYIEKAHMKVIEKYYVT